MRSRDCSECGKPAEPPLTIGRFRLPDELASLGQPVESEFVICRDCLDRLHEEEDRGREIRLISDSPPSKPYGRFSRIRLSSQ